MGRKLKFASSLTEAWVSKSHKSITLFFFILVAFFASLVYWSSKMELEILTRGTGTVIPSEDVYKIDNLEGGVLTELKVREGQVISKGDILLRIDNSSFVSALNENKKSQAVLQISLTRLKAEESGSNLKFHENFKQFKDLIENETNYYQARKKEYSDQISSYQNHMADAITELYENNSTIIRLEAEIESKELIFPKFLKEKAADAVKFDQDFYNLRKKNLSNEQKRLKEALALLNKEYAKKQELEKDGAVSEVEVMTLKRKIIETDGVLEKLQEDFLQRSAAELKERRSKRILFRKALTEIQSARTEYEKKWKSTIAKDIRQYESELSLLKEKEFSLQDKVKRSVITSPVDGVVNKVHVKNTGAVIHPGKEILEIVPSTENLVVEAAISPQDIATIHAGQKATVKVTAYDYAVYGGLEGEVIYVSPDTHTKENGEPFYKVRLRTNQNYIGIDKENLIIPGMAVQVDLVNGKRTLLEYIIKPLKRGSEEALTEK